MKKIFVSLLLLAAFSLQASAQDKYVPTEENLRNREKFQDDKFGVFIHWGIYSMLGDGEWALELNKLDAKSMRNSLPDSIRRNSMPLPGCRPLKMPVQNTLQSRRVITTVSRCSIRSIRITIS